MRRYLAILSDDRDARQRLTETGQFAKLGLALQMETRGLLAFADDAPAVCDAMAQCVVFGKLFGRDDAATPVAPGQRNQATNRIRLAPEGLMQNFWGRYVGVFNDDASTGWTVVRDPSALLPCYRYVHDGIAVIASDIGILRDLGWLKAEIDWRQLTHHLAFPGLRTVRTGLAAIDEILPGERAQLHRGNWSTSTLWNPWAFSTKDQQYRNRKEAAADLLAEVHRCVRAWESVEQGPILLELSGGLDSSIVAACLSGSDRAISSATLVTNDPASDERRYAQLVAERGGFSLVDVKIDPAEIGPTWLPSVPLPRPAGGPLHRAVDLAFLDAGRSIDACNLFSGAGGDSVFCYLSTAAPVADALLSRQSLPTIISALQDLVRLHQATTWTAARLALKKVWHRRGRKPWPKSTPFLGPAAIDIEPIEHPWRRLAPGDALPGAIEHVTGLIHMQNGLEGMERAQAISLTFPLMSQPIVEMCLRIPSWMWIDGGRNRAVARDAFQDRLPEPILQRRTKGDFASFSAQVVDKNRPLLDELLCGGLLAQHGIVDVPAIHAYLQSQALGKDAGFSDILRLAAAEQWARSW